MSEYIQAAISKVRSIAYEIQAADIEATDEEAAAGIEPLGEDLRDEVFSYTEEETALKSLQLSNEEYKIVFEDEPDEFHSHLMKLLGTNDELVQQIAEERQKLEEAKAALESVKEEYEHVKAEIRDTSRAEERKPKRRRPLTAPQEKELKEELEKLRILNNILLQLIITSEQDWAEDGTLRRLVEKCSKYI